MKGLQCVGHVVMSIIVLGEKGGNGKTCQGGDNSFIQSDLAMGNAKNASMEKLHLLCLVLPVLRGRIPVE